MKHVGIQPVYPLEMIDFKRKIYIEETPEGDVKIWNKKLLKKGCDNSLDEGEPLKEIDGCIYCPYCDEYFSYEHWENTSEYRKGTEVSISSN